MLCILHDPQFQDIIPFLKLNGDHFGVDLGIISGLWIISGAVQAKYQRVLVSSTTRLVAFRARARLSCCNVYNLQSCIIVKFVESRYAFANFEWVFLFRYSLEWGGVNANHNATHSLSLAGKNKTENDFRLLKNSDGLRDDEWNFCRRQEQTLLYFSNARDKNEKVQKIFEENQSIIVRNRAAITETKTKWIEMHQSQVNMCLLRGSLR